jgi:hypothetical protein
MNYELLCVSVIIVCFLYTVVTYALKRRRYHDGIQECVSAFYEARKLKRVNQAKDKSLWSVQYAPRFNRGHRIAFEVKRWSDIGTSLGRTIVYCGEDTASIVDFLNKLHRLADTLYFDTMFG